MIRLMFSLLHMLGGLVVKLLILIVLTNRIYDYLHGHPFDWNALLSLDALPDKFIWNVETVVPLVRDWAHEVREIGEPIVRNTVAVLKGIMATIRAAGA